MKHRASALALLAANVLPLLGVLFWGWSTFAVVVIYWAENVVLGMINILKLLFCSPSEGDNEEKSIGHASKLFFVPFFTVHYGFFCFVHGIFVFSLLGNEERAFGTPFDVWSEWGDVLRENGAIWAIAALALSHFYSFVKNYLVGGEYRRTNLPTLMIQPYSRIVVLHLAILLGAFATVALGSPVWVLVILIVGKTALDLALHLHEHRGKSDDQRDNRHNGHHRGNDGFEAGAQ